MMTERRNACVIAMTRTLPAYIVTPSDSLTFTEVNIILH